MRHVLFLIAFLASQANADECNYLTPPPAGVWKHQVCKEGNQKTSETHYGENYIHLKRIKYYEDGKIKSEATKNAQNQYVEEKEYNKLGKLIKHRPYRNGKYHGKMIDTWTGDYLKPALKYTTYVDGKQEGKMERYYSNGKLAESVNMKNDEYDGLMIKNREDGTPQEKSYWKNGKQHGKEISYSEDGKVREVEYYVDGKKHGLDVSYHPNGKVSYMTCYQNGDAIKGIKACLADKAKKDVVRTFYANGKLRSYYEAKDGEYHGAYKEFYDNGVLATLKNFAMGKLNGRMITQTKERKDIVVRNYQNGKLSGNELHYYKPKIIKTKIVWQDDGKKSETEFYMNGQKKEEKVYGDFVKRTEYGDNGKVSEKGTYKEQSSYGYTRLVRHGTIEEFTPEGKKYFKGDYNDGKEVGTHTYWYDNGKEYRVATYDAGRMTALKEYDDTGKLIRSEEYYEDGSKKSLSH